VTDPLAETADLAAPKAIAPDGRIATEAMPNSVIRDLAEAHNRLVARVEKMEAAVSQLTGITESVTRCIQKIVDRLEYEDTRDIEANE
jgi:hypothetical protein